MVIEHPGHRAEIVLSVSTLTSTPAEVLVSLGCAVRVRSIDCSPRRRR
jgi:hypothetical protein